jgi:hypothetical protein
MVKHRNLLSKQSEPPTDDPHNQTATIVPVPDQATKIARLAPATPLIAPKSTFQPLPIKVFPEVVLSIQLKRESRNWHISGIVDWAMGYGDGTVLEGGTVLLAIESKRQALLFSAEAQLLAYVATIRQLRIQANKKNVITQGFYSDGNNYRFLCIHNNGTVMKSPQYDISLGSKFLKTVFNFLLGMITIAAESSPNTSPTKIGAEQDQRIENFDRDVYVEVFEDIGVENISTPIIYHDVVEEEELSDIIIEED